MRIIVILCRWASLLVCLILITHNMPIGFDLLFLLPIFFFIFFLLMGDVFLSLSKFVASYLIITQLAIRFLIHPCLLVFLEHFDNVAPRNGNLAVVIMLIELVVSAFAIKLFAARKKLKASDKSIVLLPTGILLKALILIMFFLIYKTGYFSKVHFVWNIISSSETMRELSITSPIGSLLFLPFRFILSLYCISLIQKRTRKGKMRFFLNMLVLTCNVFIINGTSRLDIIMYGIPLLLIVIELNPKLKKTIVFSIVALLIPAIFISSIQKFSIDKEKTTSIISDNSLNAYFSGVRNIAIGIDMHSQIKTNKSTFIDDYLQNIPLLSKSVNGEHRTLVLFNKQIYNHTLYQDQIPPLSIYSLMHFSYIGVGFYVFLFSFLAFRSELKARKTERVYLKCYYYYITVIFSLLYMLNFSSVLFMLVVALFFLWPFAYFIGRIKIKI